MDESEPPIFEQNDVVSPKGRKITGVVKVIMSTGEITIGVQYPSPPGKAKRPLAFYNPIELELVNGQSG